MSCLSLSLNGVNVTDQADLKNVTIEFGNDSTNSVGYSLSSEITLVGDAAAMAKDELFGSCGISGCIEGVLTINKCGGISIPILINSRTASCTGCEVKVRLEYNNEDRNCLGYFDTHVMGDCGFFESKRHPKVRYLSLIHI